MELRTILTYKENFRSLPRTRTWHWIPSHCWHRGCLCPRAYLCRLWLERTGKERGCRMSKVTGMLSFMFLDFILVFDSGITHMYISLPCQYISLSTGFDKIQHNLESSGIKVWPKEDSTPEGRICHGGGGSSIKWIQGCPMVSSEATAFCDLLS